MCTMYFNVYTLQMKCPLRRRLRMRTAISGQKLQPEYKKLSCVPSSLLDFHTKLASYDNNCPVPQVKRPRGHPPPPFHQGLDQGVLQVQRVPKRLPHQTVPILLPHQTVQRVPKRVLHQTIQRVPKRVPYQTVQTVHRRLPQIV